MKSDVHLSRISLVAACCCLIVMGCASPEEKFLRLVEQRLEVVNGGDYAAAVEWIEPEFRRALEAEVGDLKPFLFMQRRLDQEGGRSYRVAELRAFEAKAYAEVAFERSGPGGKFDGRDVFVVPFVFREGSWWIAGEMKGGEPPQYRLRR